MANRFLTPFSGGGRSMERVPGFLPFVDLQRQMNRLFDDVFGGQAGATEGSSEGTQTRWMTPRIDITERGNEICLTAEVPGVAPQDVEVTVEDDMLILRGEKKAESEQDRGNYHVSERAYGRFQRMVQLPFSPDPDQIRANFDNGVLTVTVPRTDQARERSRRIEVQSSSSSPSGSEQQGGATIEDSTKH
jgi:HSP20 family protein